MFVLKSKYKSIEKTLAVSEDKLSEMRYAFNCLVDEYNRLVRKYNQNIDEQKKLRSGYRINIDESDLKKILILCHPDKHGGKAMAHEVTQKLLLMRAK